MPRKRVKEDANATNDSNEDLAGDGSDELLANKGKANKRKKQRPDPLFKELLTEAATEAKFKGKPNELQVQQASSTDLFLEIEEGTPTKDTIFDFFRTYNVIEFKGANDQLTVPKFQMQMARVGLWSNKHRKVALEQILNIIVSAKYPRELLKRCEERGCQFKAVPGREWLLQGLCGLQDIAIVVCERLPIEPKYAIWLIFADPKTETWRETIKMLAQKQNWKLFEAAIDLAPEEIEKMSVDLDKILEEYGPEHRAKVNRARVALIENLFPKVIEESPEELGENTTQILDTWTKRGVEKGLEQGRQEGLVEGERSGEIKMVVRQLSRKVGQPLSPETEKQISELSASQLTELGEALLDFTSLQDLTNWLSANQQS